MKQKVDKKNFCVQGRAFSLVMGSRWYLEYYETKGPVRIRIKVYGGINRIPDPAGRAIKAQQLAWDICLQGSHLKRSGSVVMDTLIKYRNTYRIKTFQSITSRVKTFLRYLEQHNITDIALTTEQANDFILELINAGLASATVKSYINSLGALYRKLGLNPWEGTMKIKVQSRSLMYFNQEQKQAIISHCRAKNRMLYIAIKILYSCFIRPGELRLLKRADFHLDQGFIEIRPEISKNGKSQKVMIPDAIMEDIEYIERLPMGVYVLTQTDKKTIGKNTLNKAHARVMRELKIFGPYAFYSWKHTGVVDAVKAGINIKDIQLQLRHHSLDMVNEYLKNLGVLDSADLRARMPRL